MSSSSESPTAAPERWRDLPWWSMDSSDVAATIGVDPATGLTEAEATARRAEFGANELIEEPARSRWAIFFGQFATR